MHELNRCHLVLAGRPVRDVWDRVRRYCGLEWSGGGPEVWAYHYFDSVSSDDPDNVEATDVLAAAALHPGLSRADLAFFTQQAERLRRWLLDVPADVSLAAADEGLLATVADVSTWGDTPSFTLLTKVLHRKRPALVPMVDREVLDWYRPVTHERSAVTAWPLLLRAVQRDLTEPNAPVLHAMTTELERLLEHRITPLRVIDIAIWMGGRA